MLLSELLPLRLSGAALPGTAILILILFAVVLAFLAGMTAVQLRKNSGKPKKKNPPHRKKQAASGDASAT